MEKIWAASRNWQQSPVDVRITAYSEIHIFEKFVAHRVCPNFSISGIKLHCIPVIYFLTESKNTCSLESYNFSNLGNICFREQLRVQFLQEIQWEMFILVPVSIGFPIETELVTARGSRYFRALKSHNFLTNKYFLIRSKNK